MFPTGRLMIRSINSPIGILDQWLTELISFRKIGDMPKRGNAQVWFGGSE
jgi:hypothetical protein